MGQRSGFPTGGDSWNDVWSARADDIYMSSMASSVTIVHTAAFYASDFNNLGASPSDYTGRSVPFTGTYGTLSGNSVPTAMQFRVVDELNVNTVYQNWTTITAFSASAGTWSGNGLVLPTPETGRLQVRFFNDTSIRNSASTTIAVGPAVAGYGQSNSGAAYQSGSPDSAIDPYRTRSTYSFQGRCLAAGPRTWGRNLDNTTSQVLSRQLQTYYGLTCGIVGDGFPSQPIISLRKIGNAVTYADPYDSNIAKLPYVLFANQLAAAGVVGRVAAWIIDQGEAESDGSAPNDISGYQTDWLQTISDLRTDFSASRNVLTMFTITGRITNAISGSMNANASAVRAKQKEFTTLITNTIIGHHNVGHLMADDYHYGSPAHIEKHRRNGKSLAFAFGATGYKGSGPQTLTGTRSGAVITIPITANGATSYSALSGLDGTTAGSSSALTSWEVSANDFASNLSITSVVLSGTNIVITLSANPGATVKVRNHYGKNPDISSWVFGTYADGFKIAVVRLFFPITVA